MTKRLFAKPPYLKLLLFLLALFVLFADRIPDSFETPVTFVVILLIFITAVSLHRRFSPTSHKAAVVRWLAALLLTLAVLPVDSWLRTWPDSRWKDIGILTNSFLFFLGLFSLFILPLSRLSRQNPFSRLVLFPLRLFKKSLNFKTLVVVNLAAIIMGSLVINQAFQNADRRLANLENKFGGQAKSACTDEQTKLAISANVFRIIGAYGEGSGFPISSDYILTSFHVIEGETSPKVVFPDGRIETPVKIMGNKAKDFAILTVDTELTPLEFFYFDQTKSYSGLMIGEPLYAFGYPLGSAIKGEPAVIKGSFSGSRWLPQVNTEVIESSINVVEGMSGGPLVDSCGKVVGVNTLAVGGFSMFLKFSNVLDAVSETSDKDIARIEIDTGSPEGAVKAFYQFIKSRNLKKAYDLLSAGRKSGITSFEDWTEGYARTLQVNLIMSEVDEADKNTVKVKIQSMDWVDGDLVFKYFQGDWQVVEENGDYKLDTSTIEEVKKPDFWWFYSWEIPAWME